MISLLKKYLTNLQLRNGEEDHALEEWFQKEISREYLNLKKHFLLKFLRMKQAVHLDRKASSRFLPSSEGTNTDDTDTLDLL